MCIFERERGDNNIYKEKGGRIEKQKREILKTIIWNKRKRESEIVSLVVKQLKKHALDW